MTIPSKIHSIFRTFAIVGLSTSCFAQTITIKHTSTPPVFDGIPDAIWSGLESVSLDNVFIQSSIDPEDASATVSALWDENYLYLLYEVEDDIFGTDSPAGWQDDAVQVYLDGDNAKGTTYDSNDSELYMRRSHTGGVEGTANPYKSDVTWAVSERPNGYSAEVRIAWDGFPFTPVGGSVFGIDFQVNDDDGGNPNAVIKWADTTGTGNRNPSHFGTATLSADDVSPLADIIIRRTTLAPSLDGVIDPIWDGAESWILEQPYVVSTLPESDDLSASVKALWDEDNLYLLYIVTDDQYSDDSPAGWQDDSVQLYLDADRSAGSTFDANDDWILFRRNDTKPAEGDSIDKPYRSNVSWATSETTTGYVTEIVMPWSAFGQSPIPDLLFGIDFQVNDDDNQDASPDAVIKFFDTVGDGYANASRMGGALLSAHAVPLPLDQGPTEFLGFNVVDGWISTGDRMGNLYVRHAPFAWSEATGQWLCFSEYTEGSDGVWFYFY